jgi:hypothetical protein
MRWLLLSLALIPSVWAGDAKPQARLGELLIVAESVEYTHVLKTPPEDQHSRPGFHFVHITGTVSNVGKHALCGLLFATLENTYNLESFGTVRFGGVPLGGIHQLLPGEELHASFDFDVKDGVEPLRLIIKQNEKGQGCSRKEPLLLTNRQVSFTVADIPTNK